MTLIICVQTYKKFGLEAKIGVGTFVCLIYIQNVKQKNSRKHFQYLETFSKPSTLSIFCWIYKRISISIVIFQYWCPPLVMTSTYNKKQQKTSNKQHMSWHWMQHMTLGNLIQKNLKFWKTFFFTIFFHFFPLKNSM